MKVDVALSDDDTANKLSGIDDDGGVFVNALTWDDVDWLTKIADNILDPADAAKGRDLRDRITAFLPPRES